MSNLLNQMATEKKYVKSEEIEVPFKFAKKWQNLPEEVSPFNIELPGLEFINIRNSY